MLSCTIALLLTCTALAVYELVTSRTDTQKEYDTMAAVLAENVAATLAFRDPDAAASTLSTLRAVPEIQAAAVFDSDGSLFAVFHAERPVSDASSGEPAEAAPSVTEAPIGGRSMTNPGTREPPTTKPAAGDPSTDVAASDRSTDVAADELRRGESPSWMQDESWWSNRVAVQQPIMLSDARLGTIHIHGMRPGLGTRLFPYGTAATVILLMAAAVAYVLSRRLQREVSVPIQLLSAAAERVSHDNDYTVRAPVVNDDEIGRLTRTFNEMLGRIQRHDRELRLAKDAAEEMARLKSAFLANMSHEIRTPLTGILGFTQMLADEVSGHQQDWVDCVQQSARRLLDTLNSVLDLARIESGSLDIEFVQVDVVDEVNHVAQFFAPLAGEKGLTIEVRQRTGTTHVETDPNWLTRILQNLVRNAIKFTDTGSVTISVDGTAEALVLEIADTGIGISTEFIPHLFDEFKQESAGLTRSHEGTGLGLAITHKLVDRMGGSIEVQSEKDVGSTFTVKIPRRPAEAFASTGT